MLTRCDWSVGHSRAPLSPGRPGDQPPVIVIIHHSRDGVANLLRSREIPEVREIAALLRLDGLHGAVIGVQKNATAVRLFLQGQTATIPAQPSELLDEVGLAHAIERGEPRNFLIRQAHLTRPAAAGRATLAFVKNRHA